MRLSGCPLLHFHPTQTHSQFWRSTNTFPAREITRRFAWPSPAYQQMRALYHNLALKSKRARFVSVMGWAIARTQELFASAIRLLRSLSLTESAAAISLDKKLLFSQSSLDKATCCKQRLSYACRFRRLTHAQSASPPWRGRGQTARIW